MELNENSEATIADLDMAVESNEVEISEEVHSDEGEKRGYRTYQEFVDEGGDPAEFQGEKAYNAYGRLIKDVKKLQQEVKKKNLALDTMADLYRKEEERIAMKYRDYYQHQQRRLAEAEQQGDVGIVKEAALELSRTEQQYNQDKQMATAAYQNKLVEAFKERNEDWYNSNNPDLITRAQQLAIQYEREYPHLANTDPNYLLQKVEDEIRTRYLTAANYSGERKEVGGANYTLPPSQSTNNKGLASKSKLQSLTPELREEYNQVKQFYSQTGIAYTIDDFLSFHERNKV